MEKDSEEIKEGTLGDIQDALAGGAKEVAGKTVGSPEAIVEKINRVEEYCKAKGVKFDKEKIYVTTLPGHEVGKSEADRIKIDRVALIAYPFSRFLHLVGHELAHDYNRIQNEGLVEAYARTVFGVKGNLDEKYQEHLEDFQKFSAKAAGVNGKDQEAMTEEIYDYYYNDEFDKIFALLGDESEESLNLFENAFPELEYDVEEGKYKVDVPDEFTNQVNGETVEEVEENDEVTRRREEDEKGEE
ncbi:MAG: hypothetical protein V1679_01910 [Candidatus Peregrinibacteria bacterium]